jgi:arginyl-tRNA synthetase
MTVHALANKIRDVLAEVAQECELSIPDVHDIQIDRPRKPEHGDWSSNIAMQLAKHTKLGARELAAAVAHRLSKVEGIARVEVAGPGFLNITLSPHLAGEIVRTVVSEGEAYGRNQTLAGRLVNLEFVSANPTGPVHLGGARWAAVGDALARVLEACGARVTREYYFNDHGAQIERFANSVLAAARGREVPEDGYSGSYIGEIAARVISADPSVLNLPDETAKEMFRAHGVESMFTDIKSSLRNFGVQFEVFFHEKTLHDSGAVEDAIRRLEERGLTLVKDGALWLRTTMFGDDKDRVLRKGDGQYTYFSGDIAYYINKRARGFDMVITLLGADHDGYVRRMMAMCAALGDEPYHNLNILIGQLVNLVKDGEPVRMSKRAGNVVVMDDLVDAVGVDAARYSLARNGMDTALDIDVALLVQKSFDNPVYYVQYAHARTHAVSIHANQASIRREDGFDATLLTHPTEAGLANLLADFPRVVAKAAQEYQPHRIAHYLESLAAHYHKWYGACRVSPRTGVDDLPRKLSSTRLWLNDATKQVLANGLFLIGVSAPDRL